MNAQAPNRPSCPAGLLLGVFLALWGSASAATAGEIDLQDIPVFLSQGAPPNLVLTVDDSRSMDWGVLPDSLRAVGSDLNRILTSPQVNLLYYNPRRTYLPPADAVGASHGHQSFTAAQRNFFRLQGCTGCGADCPTSCSATSGSVHGFDCTTDLSSDFAAIARTSNERCAPLVADDVVPDRGHPDFAYWNDRNLSGGIESNWGSLCIGGQVTYTDSDGLPVTAYVNLDCPAYYTVFDSGNDPAQCTVVSYPDAGTPDICFDRILVGSPDDLDYAYCENAYRAADCVPRNDVGLIDSNENGDDLARDLLSRRNFANWYAYYRDRYSLIKTALSRSMFRLSAPVRFGYEGFTGGEAIDDNFLPNSSSAMGRFYDWLFAQPSASASSLYASVRGARDFFGSGASGVPEDLAYAADIERFKEGVGPPANPLVGCRPNLHLIATDGGWEDGYEISVNEPLEDAGYPGGYQEFLSSSMANADGMTWTLPASDHVGGDLGVNEYTPRVPYRDGNSMSLADEVFKSWVQDLRTDLSNLVPRSIPYVTDDPQESFWDHRNDPASWQHVRTFAIGLGVNGNVNYVDGSLNPPDGDWTYTDQSGTTLSGTVSEDGFPGSLNLYLVTDTNQTYGDDWRSQSLDSWKIDDLWHAAINGRGEYFSATSPETLETALRRVPDVLNATAGETALAAPAFSSGALGSGALVFQATMDPRRWSGDLLAYGISAGLGREPCPSQARGEICAGPPEWSAAQILDDRAISSRRILTRGADKNAREFVQPGLWDHLTEAQQSGLEAIAVTHPTLTPKAQAQLLIDYLRGSDVHEAQNQPAEAAVRFRERDSRLGDIINGTPVVVGPPNRIYTDHDYALFRTVKSQRPSIVYLGANDGMLHAFAADREENGGGAEIFAYVPEFLYGKLYRLAQLDYNHEAYMDGPIAEGDAYFGGRWETVLVASAGGGAQGLLALKVTDPKVFLGQDLSGVLLWEFSDKGDRGGDDDLGYVLGRPAIVRIPQTGSEPRWVALVGNGYNNSDDDGARPAGCAVTDATLELAAQAPDPSNPEQAAAIEAVRQDAGEDLCGEAILFVLDIEDGTIVKQFGTGVGRRDDPESAYAGADRHPRYPRPNGLGQPVTTDIDGDLVADTAYAGDLFGNVWRFNLSNLNSAPVKLFTAKDASGRTQPITAPIAVAPHPTGKGYLLLFGTGYLMGRHEPDFERDKVQTFYGIWDDGATSDLDGQTARSETPLPRLQAQTFIDVSEFTQDSGGQVVSEGRVTSDNRVRWDLGQKGWYLDLPAPPEGQANAQPAAERVTTKAEIYDTRVVFVSTVPGDDSCASAGGSYSWINALDLRDGSRLSLTPFDYDFDGAFGVNDLFSVTGNGQPLTAPGSSIRLPGGGVYSSPASLAMDAGNIRTVISGSQGGLDALLQSTTLGWRNWQQLR